MNSELYLYRLYLLFYNNFYYHAYLKPSQKKKQFTHEGTVFKNSTNLQHNLYQNRK